MTDENAPTVRDRFQALCDGHYATTGHRPTQCQLSLALARQAAKEHTDSRTFGPMFQSWDPTMRFIVEVSAPDGLLCVSSPPSTPQTT